ncbi:MAG: alpha/beta hydrolase [Patescibacteria group bacterium]
MIKNAIILHGSGSNPKSFWLPSISRYLLKNNYEVWAPLLPDAGQPDLKTWLPFVLGRGQFNSSTILIGHSAGSPLILSILENIPAVINQAILVAGYARPLGQSKSNKSILQDVYDWGKIKQHVSDIIFINSDNDPWGCDYEEGLYMWHNIGGTLILRAEEGHMGSDLFHQPYQEFPLLERIIKI